MGEIWTGNGSNLPKHGLSAVTSVGSRPEDVLKWWSVPEDVVDAVVGGTKTCAYGFLLLPCFWPFLCCTIPVIFTSISATKSMTESLIFILTPYRLIWTRETQAFGYSSGMDVDSVSLRDIQSVRTDRQGGGPFSSLNYASVRIQLPGFTAVGTMEDRRYTQNGISLPARDEEVDGITAAIVNARDRLEYGGGTIPVLRPELSGGPVRGMF